MRVFTKIASVGALMLALAGAAVAVATPSPAMAQGCYTVPLVEEQLTAQGIGYEVLAGAKLTALLKALAAADIYVPDGVTAAIVGAWDNHWYYGLEIGGCLTPPAEMPVPPEQISGLTPSGYIGA